MMNNYNYSDNDGFSLSEQDAEELATRLQVGKSIITFNATKLRGICSTMLTLHESFRRNVLWKNDVALNEPTLNSKQMAMALEFFLQIDGKSSSSSSFMHTSFQTYTSMSRGKRRDSGTPVLHCTSLVLHSYFAASRKVQVKYECSTVEYSEVRVEFRWSTIEVRVEYVWSKI
jgi:hypothetical protein